MTKPYRNQLQRDISCMHAYMCFHMQSTVDVNSKNALNHNCYYYPYSRSQIIKDT